MCHAHLALRLALSFAMSDLRAFQLPRTGYHACSFYCTFCIISAPPSHPSGTKNAKASNAAAPNIRHARHCLSASSSQCPACSHSSYHERAIMRVHFFASSALFSAPSTHPSATNKRRGFKCSRAKHAHRGLPCGLNLARHGRRTSVNADGRP